MAALEMTHCIVCGSELEMRYEEGEGMTPYCPHCQAFRYPVFNVACSMIVLDPAKERIVLIKQYGRDSNILVAGYVMKGEDAEFTAVREIREELGVGVSELRFNHSHYYAPTNTLMLNFTAVADSSDLHPNREIDHYQWFSLADARANIKPDSLAQSFLEGYFTKTWDFNYHN